MNTSLLEPRGLASRILRRFRPQPEPDKWKLHFEESLPAFRRFLAQCEFPEFSRDQPAAAVLVTPWGWGEVPWYAIALGIGLMQRGRRVVFVWDDTDLIDEGMNSVQNRCIGEMLQLLPSHVEVVRLTEQLSAPARDGDEAKLAELIRINEVWRTRAGKPGEEDLRISRGMARTYVNTLSKARSLFQQRPFDYFVVINGIIWSSSVLLLASSEAGVRHVTYDANVGVNQFSNNGLAAQQTDLAGAFQELLREPPAVREWMVKQAQAAFEDRVQARDPAAYQHAKPSDNAKKVAGDVLMLMNVEWDSAALQGHHIFKNSADWIIQTVSHILDTSEKTVVVRQHPSERRPLERSKLDIIAILQERFGANPRLRTVLAADDVNTYDLAREASLVVPFVSTIGVETAAMGKPTLQSGTCYYSSMGFVWWPQNREQYFQLLDRGLRGDLPKLPEQEERAWICYYLTPLCNRIWSVFAPQPFDFDKWVQVPPTELFALPEVQDILESLETDTSAALVRHRRAKKAAGI